MIATATTMAEKWKKSLRSRTGNIMRLSFVRFISHTPASALFVTYQWTLLVCIWCRWRWIWDECGGCFGASVTQKKKAVKWSEKRENGREMRHNSEHDVDGDNADTTRRRRRCRQRMRLNSCHEYVLIYKVYQHTESTSLSLCKGNAGWSDINFY